MSNQHSRSATPSSNVGTPLSSADNAEEWVGLEYALEVSKADAHPPRVEENRVAEGEYSKVCGGSLVSRLTAHASTAQSRESWIALHQDYFDPDIEEWAFHQWQRWHSHLEREDARRRAQRTTDYLTISTHRSWLYLQERKLRDWICSTVSRYGKGSRFVLTYCNRRAT